MLAFDHLVIVSNSIEQAAMEFGKQYNQLTIQGGNHENWGTYNYLSFMKNNSYIEWLGVKEEAKAAASDNPLIQQTAEATKKNIVGPITFAFRTTKMDELISYYDKEGISYKGPFPGRRTRPDGTLLKWRMLFPESTAYKGTLPFLIEWNGDGNRPTDPTQINETAFTSIAIGVDNIDEFQVLYRLGEPKQDNKWVLENGTLLLHSNQGLEAQFEHIMISTKNQLG